MRRVVTSAAVVMMLSGGAVSAAVASKQQPAKSGSSTYIGCLRAADEGRFMLTEVGGPSVPEARTWRSLYMSKERVLDVEPARSLDLSAHVGHTVKVTGQLEGKTLQAQSMTMVGATCK
jgi:hypothetical protein